MLPRSFYFLRHGETDWNKEFRLQGHVDIPLNEQGREQARIAATTLMTLPIDRIISSPLSRALETAKIVNTSLQKPFETDDRLREKSFGYFEGKSRQEIEAWRKENPDKMGLIEPETGFPVPYQGEAFPDFKMRVFDAFKENMEKYPDENILFVAHGGVYSALHYMLLNKIKHSQNAEPFHFVREAPQQWSLLAPTITY